MRKIIGLVSHSKKITDGLKEMIDQMSQTDQVEVLSLGGTADGELGSDPTLILDALDTLDTTDIFFAFADLGSAVMNVEMVVDMIDEEKRARYILVDAPLVEGAFAAAITAGVTDDIEQIIHEAKNAGEKGWS
ncbi:PTS mannose transporter subunit IIA [Vagococcus penaei]|uniref:phosphoenolpyruvate--glycerone phosphotransferase n=1 Tax=Vagococcus penaei TaxID=633807 RepID=A0A1Q2D472_9ENTE|nr:dihydroxyacetone kinase phosphoryl donor subunit DhaM [Vagococcus penaei]AQP53143.1 PTS mannnose transporter subunit IIA [Vagococcus penaei]RSU05994.1 PTS mannose transporter subunit IIA [Vagococcus penaei]